MTENDLICADNFAKGATELIFKRIYTHLNLKKCKNELEELNDECYLNFSILYFVYYGIVVKNSNNLSIICPNDEKRKAFVKRYNEERSIIEANPIEMTIEYVSWIVNDFLLNYSKNNKNYLFSEEEIYKKIRQMLKNNNL